MTVIDLTARRLERLEKAQKQTNESLGRIANVLDTHTTHFERLEDALAGISVGIDRMSDRISDRFDRMTERVDLLTNAIARGRTHDLFRFDKMERRLMALETRTKRKRR